MINLLTVAAPNLLHIDGRLDLLLKVGVTTLETLSLLEMLPVVVK
jgi:hypothetical protein